MSRFKTLDDLGDVRGRTVLVREDLNVPMADGQVADDTRLRAALPTLLELADCGAKVLVLAHFGRPKGKADEKYSLRQVVPALAAVLGRPVGFAAVGEHPALDDGAIAVIENTRFDPGEETNDPGFVQKLASLGDIYVNDAFSAAHRAHVMPDSSSIPQPDGSAWRSRPSSAPGSALHGSNPKWCTLRPKGRSAGQHVAGRAATESP